MKRGIKALAAVALAALLIPGSSTAAAQLIDCDGVADAGGNGTCTDTFNLTLESGFKFISTLDSWGDHSGGLLEMGSVQLRWVDGADNVVASYTCVALGLPIHAVRQPCTEDFQTLPTYVVGTQTLVVNAIGVPAGASFHGQISLADSGDLI